MVGETMGTRQLSEDLYVALDQRITSFLLLLALELKSLLCVAMVSMNDLVSSLL